MYIRSDQQSLWYTHVGTQARPKQSTKHAILFPNDKMNGLKVNGSKQALHHQTKFATLI